MHEKSRIYRVLSHCAELGVIMSNSTDWKRNIEALGSFLGPSGPTSAGASLVTDTGSKMLQALESAGATEVPLDAICERIGVTIREAANAAESLESARLILVERNAVIPVIRLTEAGRQIAVAAATAPPQ